ncbi:hypothetical protein ACLOJK_017279 [Asimina triloba]
MGHKSSELSGDDMSSDINTIPLLDHGEKGNGKKASPGDGRRSLSSSSSEKRNSRRPEGNIFLTLSKFTQQELPACKPVLTPGWVVEIVDRYDIACIPENLRKDRVPKHMKSPIFVYYQLDNYYQNHRRYVRSRSNEQLRYRKSENDTSDCDPEATTWNGSAIVPCGLIAWSLFNDTYHFTLNNSMALEVNKKSIAWKSDQYDKFGDKVYPKNFQSGGLIGGAKLNASQPLSEQEDLMVWMRIAALPTFQKLYGKIEVDLEPNEKITVVIQNKYNTYSFGGKKKLILSTTSWIGGRNDFLGVAYVTVGGLCIFLALSSALLHVVMPRPEEDIYYLSWNIRASGYLNQDGTTFRRP